MAERKPGRGIPRAVDAIHTATPAEVQLVQSDSVDGFGQLSEQQYAQLVEIARVDLNASNETLAAMGAEELNRAQMSILRAGAYFLKLKQQAGHGGYLPALEAAHVEERAAQRAVQIAEYVATLPASQAKRIAVLPPTKILPLVNADQEIVAELLESGELDGDRPLSVRAVIRRLKEAQQEAADAKIVAKSALDTLQKLQSGRIHTGTVNPAMAVTRDEIVFITERMSHEVAHLRQIAEKLDAPDWRSLPDQADRQHVAGMLFHTLNGIVAQAWQIVDGMERSFPSATGGIQSGMQYTVAESEDLQRLREQALTAVTQEVRQARGESQKKHKPRGRHIDLGTER